MSSVELTSAQRESLEAVHWPNFLTTKPVLYRFQRRDESGRFLANEARVCLLFGAGDAGGTNALLPVWKRLANEDVNFYIVANNVAAKALEEKGRSLQLIPVPNFDPLKTMPKLDVNLIISGHSVNPDMGQVLFGMGRERGIGTIGISDMPPFWGMYKRELAQAGRLIVPDRLFVLSDVAARQEAQFVPELEGRMEVMGNPDFDALSEINVPKVRTEVRRQLGIGDDIKMVAYMATKDKSATGLADLVVKGLRALSRDDWRLALRIHPQEWGDPEIRAVYEEMLAPIKDRVIETMEGVNKLPTDKIRLAADLNITDTSTEGEHSVRSGIQTLHVRIKEIMHRRSDWEDVLPPVPSVVLNGFSHFMEDEENNPDVWLGKMVGVLTKALYDPKAIAEKAALMSALEVDGHATERYINRFLELAN